MYLPTSLVAGAIVLTKLHIAKAADADSFAATPFLAAEGAVAMTGVLLRFWKAPT